MRRIIVLAAAAVLAAPALAQDFGAALPAGRDSETSPSQGWTFGTACEYQIDSGVSNNSIGLINGGEMAALFPFQSDNSCETITHIGMGIGTPAFPSGIFLGSTVRVFVWDDPNNDGDPSDMVFIQENSGVVTEEDNDVMNMIALDPPVAVDSAFFAGFSIVQDAGTFPAGYDQTISSNGRTWATGAPAPPFDPSNPEITLTDLGTIAGLDGVWMLRAFSEGGCEPCDMNCDGAVNAFDIEPFLDLLFGPNPMPCCEGVGDVNGDGNVNAFDIEPFLDCLFP